MDDQNVTTPQEETAQFCETPALQEELLPPLQEELPPAPLPTVTVVDIHFRNGSKVYFFDPGDLVIPTGEHVIIDTARGPEYGICAAANHRIGAKDVVAPLRPVLRIANDHDRQLVQEHEEKEKKAMEICHQKIAFHKLDMQLVSAEYAFDGSKILFFFTAEGRVDFRELVKNLASALRTRIELRQIGVRDKAKMVGGLGVCGRPFCCSQFLDDFQPVSIKMAKTQSLSLNPTKISGTCGRLMCCLKYEQESYESLIKTSPKNDSLVDTPQGRGTVCDVNLLRQSVRVRLEDHPGELHSFKNDEIAVLRNGKARKNDPPIPRDVAPISANRPKPAKPAMVRTQDLLVEPTIIAETVENLSQQKQDKKPNNRRKPPVKQDGTKQNPPKNGQPQKGNPPKQNPPKPNQPKPTQPKGDQPPKPRPPKPQPPKGDAPQKPRPPKPQSPKPQGDNPAPATPNEAQKPKSNNRRRYRPRRPKNPNGGQNSNNSAPKSGE